MEQKEEITKLKLKQVDRSFPTTKPTKNIISVNCPSCDASPAIENINIHDKIVKCGGCATVYSFDEEVKHLAELNEKTAQEIVVRPAAIEKSYFHDELELSMKQPTGGFWIIMAVTLVFFAGLFYLVSLKEGYSVYWSAGMVGLSLAFFYKYWNSPNDKIYINLDAEYLTIQYRPKHFVKDKFIATREIEQLYTKTLASNYYSLYAVLNTREGQKHVKLIKYMETRKNARYIELEVEKYLGIEDRRLPEE